MDPNKEAGATANEVLASTNEQASEPSKDDTIPWRIKAVAVVLVSLIGFGSHWSGGVTGAMKSTIKKKLHINNAQYAVLEASEDFMKTALILVSGVVTDRIGGASAMLWGNAIYSIGAILIAAATTVRSYKFMIFGIIVQALGDIATQVAQYKVFSSWFAPSHGFASTLGFELGLGKIGGFLGKATANVIAVRTGDFKWVYWCAVFMNLFTNAATLVFWLFTRWCERHYAGTRDPATGERLTERNKKFEWSKMLRLPWPFWLVASFTLFQTSTASVFGQNATEFAEQRFDVSAETAGWYSAMSKYLGFFLVPALGVFIDVCGHRITIMMVCGAGMLLSMCLAAWGPTVRGTAASFGVYAFAASLGPTVVIDSIRTTMFYQEVFGSGYAIKNAINNSMNIIIRVVTGVIQDQDDNSYDRVVIVYVFLSAGSVVVGLVMLIWGYFDIILGRLQWTRKQRLAKGHLINKRKEDFENDEYAERNRRLSMTCFGAVILMILGAWAAYFWGVATGNNK
ncbi:MFS transporter, partial [Metarhizium majus ARSEF 297]